MYIPQKVLDLNQNCISAMSALLVAAYFKALLYFVLKIFHNIGERITYEFFSAPKFSKLCYCCLAYHCLGKMLPVRLIVCPSIKVSILEVVVL